MTVQSKSSLAALVPSLLVSALLAAACTAGNSGEHTIEQGQRETKPCGDDDDGSDAGQAADAAPAPMVKDAEAPPAQVPDAATAPTDGWDCDDPKGCDFVGQTGCPGGQACFLRDGSWGTQCAAPGKGRSGSTCSQNTDCDRGFLCSLGMCWGGCGAGAVPKSCRDDGAFGCKSVIKDKQHCNYGICSNTVSL